MVSRQQFEVVVLLKKLQRQPQPQPLEAKAKAVTLKQKKEMTLKKFQQHLHQILEVKLTISLET